MFAKRQKKQPRRPGQPPSGSPVFSYYNNRPADIRSATQRKRGSFPLNQSRRVVIKYHLHRLPSYVASLLVGGSVLYTLTLQTQPKVLVGRSSGNNTLLRSSDTYQVAISGILSSSFFNKNKLTINTEAIAQKIRSMFPEIQTATVSIPLIGRRPIIGLDPAEPTLLFNSSKSGSFVMGSDGRLLIGTADLDKGSPLPKLPTLQDDSGIAVEQGKQALPKENVTFITTVLFQLSSKQVGVETIQLPAIPNEVRLRLSGSNYYVRFNLAGDARIQAGALLAVRGRLQGQNITPAEYIDVRVEDRAYYK